MKVEMKIEKVIDMLLVPIENNVPRNANNKLEDLSGRGVLRSSFTITESVSEISKSLNEELIMLYKKISKLDTGIKELIKIKKSVNEFSERQYSNWVNGLREKRLFEIGTDGMKESIEAFIQRKIDETKTVIEFETIVLIRNLKNGRKAFWWDISKIALSAILGGFIGGYLKTLF